MKSMPAQNQIKEKTADSEKITINLGFVAAAACSSRIRWHTMVIQKLLPPRSRS